VEGGGRVDPHVTDETVAAAQKSSRGWIRSAVAHGATAWRRRDQLEISPNALGGVGLVRRARHRAGGDPRRRGADQEYQDVGIDTFIMWVTPHLEEAYRFASWCSRCCRCAANNVTPIRVNTGPSANHRQRIPAAETGSQS